MDHLLKSCSPYITINCGNDNFTKAVSYDKWPKMKRDAWQKSSPSLKKDCFFVRHLSSFSNVRHTKWLYKTQIIMEREQNNWVYPTESSSAMIRPMTFSKVRRSKLKNSMKADQNAGVTWVNSTPVQLAIIPVQ